ncbi:MAG: hypothetical protein ACKOAY_09555 [Haliscomenobacter sp.]
MDISKKINLVIYRFREKGLEVFLVNPSDNENWTLPAEPQTEASQLLPLHHGDSLIELEPVDSADGETEQTWAVEGDWHDIPSLKSMLLEDAANLRNKLADMEKGGFFAVKEAFKKVLPHQYKLLKELKEILADRNSVKNI